jgi:hypothetical protein
VAANALAVSTLFHLTDALVVADQANEIDAVLSAWEGALPPHLRPQIMPPVKALTLYQAGKLAECEAVCAQTPLLQASAARAQALLAMGKADQAAADPELAKVWDDPWTALALCVALQLDGHAAAAGTWRSKALGRLPQEGRDGKRVAALLAAAEAPAADSVSRLSIMPGEKVLVLAALAARFPAQREQYLARAAILNIRHTPPYHLVHRALERQPEARP